MVFAVEGITSGRWRRVFYEEVSPKWFGAIGDGISDDTLSVQKAIDWVSGTFSVLTINDTYKISNVMIRTAKRSCKGSGTILGTITVGESSKRAYDMYFDGLTFSGINSGIVLYHARRVNIRNCVFNGCEAAISTSPSSSEFHSNAQIEIINNTFNSVKYAVAINSTGRWDVNSDWTFAGNLIAKALIYTLYAPQGLDGLKFINNFLFNSLSDTERANAENHLFIGNMSDWVIIAENNFFEAKKESIVMTNAKNANINNNNFAWTGQSGVYSVAKFNGSSSDSIRFIKFNDNVCDWFSGSVIKLESPYNGVVNATGNSVYYADTLSLYYGTVDLSTIDHYIVESDSYTSIYESNSIHPLYKKNLKEVKNSFLIHGHCVIKSSNLLNTFGQIPFVVIKGENVALFSLYNANRAVTNYNGKINMVVKVGAPGGMNSAFYEIGVFKGASTLPASVVEGMKGGLIDGLNTNWPSFSFSVVDDILYATGINKTEGTFFLSYESFGDLILSESVNK